MLALDRKMNNFSEAIFYGAMNLDLPPSAEFCFDTFARMPLEFKELLFRTAAAATRLLILLFCLGRALRLPSRIHSTGCR